MFTVSYEDFINRSCFSNFSINYMPGLKIMHMDSAKCIINLDSKSVYIYY